MIGARAAAMTLIIINATTISTSEKPKIFFIVILLNLYPLKKGITKYQHFCHNDDIYSIFTLVIDILTILFKLYTHI